jgi:hypothetical protein
MYFNTIIDEEKKFYNIENQGMVVFRLKGENDMTEKLLKKLNGSGKAHPGATTLSIMTSIITIR